MEKKTQAQLMAALEKAPREVLAVTALLLASALIKVGDKTIPPPPESLDEFELVAMFTGMATESFLDHAKAKVEAEPVLEPELMAKAQAGAEAEMLDMLARFKGPMQ